LPLERTMKHTIASLALIGTLAALPLGAHAMMTDAEATTAVQDMLIQRKSSQEVLGALIKDGRTLQQATVLSVQAVTGHAKVNLARVGICMSRDNDEAEAVARACVNACAPVTEEIIKSLVQSYVTGGCEKLEYQFHGTPPPAVGGAGEGLVSPSS
jgi:hypothetical protein